MLGAAVPSAPRGWDPRKEIFFSMSCERTCSWLVTCASKSLILFVTFLRSCASPALPVSRTLPVPSSGSPPPPPPVASSESTLDSSFLKRSPTSACEASVFFLRVACSSRVSAATTSEAYFFTSARTCERSAVEASRSVANMDSVSFSTARKCSHSAVTSGRLILPQAFASNANTDSVCRWPACMVSMSKFWLASMVARM
mmetsp:Transcript_55123/g.176649  ORF Transcript_55123/g.176649 Transcript_55123/m.176649 type:complete len:200 (+) Transcript_55123:1883-2482(+)